MLVLHFHLRVAVGLVYLRGCYESVCCRVSIIPGCEVSVEGCDDSVLLSFLHVTPEKQNIKIYEFGKTTQVTSTK